MPYWTKAFSDAAGGGSGAQQPDAGHLFHVVEHFVKGIGAFAQYRLVFPDRPGNPVREQAEMAGTRIDIFHF